jgi:hypothetical protein
MSKCKYSLLSCGIDVITQAKLVLIALKFQQKEKKDCVGDNFTYWLVKSISYSIPTLIHSVDSPLIFASATKNKVYPSFH